MTETLATRNGAVKKGHREEFFRMISKFLTADEQVSVENNYFFAKGVLRHVKRKEIDPETGQPKRGWEHTIGVVYIIVEVIGVRDVDEINAALDHDVLEDNRYVYRRHLDRLIGQESTRIVLAVTKEPKAGHEERLTAGGPKAIRLKLADRLQNMRSLHLCDRAFRLKQTKETSDFYIPVFEEYCDLMEREMSPYAKGSRAALDELIEIIDREEARLARDE